MPKEKKISEDMKRATREQAMLEKMDEATDSRETSYLPAITMGIIAVLFLFGGGYVSSSSQ